MWAGLDVHRRLQRDPPHSRGLPMSTPLPPEHLNFPLVLRVESLLCGAPLGSHVRGQSLSLPSPLAALMVELSSAPLAPEGHV